MHEFLRRYFSKSLEAGDFGVRSESLDGLQPFFVAVAIVGDKVRLFCVGCLLLGISLGDDLFVLDFGSSVANTEKWCLQHIDMPFLDEFGEELQEESDDEQSDVHAIDIGICGHDNFVVTQRVNSLFNI